MMMVRPCAALMGRRALPRVSCHNISRGGRSTKIHALVDDNGRTLPFVVTGGQVHDNQVVGQLLCPATACRWHLRTQCTRRPALSVETPAERAIISARPGFACGIRETNNRAPSLFRGR